MTEKNENKIVARVEGVEITERDVDALVAAMGPQGAQFRSEKGRNLLKDELVNQTLLYRDAIDRKLDQDPEFVAQLEAQKRQLLQQYALHKLLEEATVTPEEIDEYFEKHKDRVTPSYRFKASHVLVGSEEEAKEVREKIRNGLDFAEAAKQYSSCPSSARGGDLGSFESGRMVPEFEAACLAMNVGEISEPVKTQFGYHLIHLAEKEKVSDADFDQAKEEMAHECRLIRQQDHYRERIAELSGKYHVEKYYGESND